MPLFVLFAGRFEILDDPANNELYLEKTKFLCAYLENSPSMDF